MNFFLVTFFLVFVPDGQTDGQTDRQTDRQTDGQKATPKSPLCMSTGGLKNVKKSTNFHFASNK